MEQLLSERSLIERELDCENQEPIEVVLVFETQEKENSLSKKSHLSSIPAVTTPPNNFQVQQLISVKV